MDVYSAELQDFIKKLTKDEFIADFINYENTLKVSAKDDESTEENNLKLQKMIKWILTVKKWIMIKKKMQKMS